MVDSTAHVTWNGSLTDGAGTITSVGSGVLPSLPVSWSARIGEADGQTTPEELLAAAHASCFSMALSHGLAQAGTPPQSLDVDATVTFVPGTGISKIALRVVGEVPGIDEGAFVEAAEAAKDGCPVSKALASVHEISLEAALA
jgi:lipoyl-dependent peroxiredoxin